jgi:hypothetical protein
VTRNLAHRFVIAACLLAVMIAPLTSTAPSAASDQPDQFHWAREKSQFTIQAVNNVDGDWKKLLGNAINDWEKSDVVTIKEVDGNHTRSQDCNSDKGKIVVCNWNYGTQDGWLGLTRLFFDKDGIHINAATVEMNDSFFNQKNGDYNNDNARKHTICHEMGHAIGLDHADTKSCLNHSQYAVFHYTAPINKDYRQLQDIYQHHDSFTTIAGKQKDEKNHNKNKKDKNGKKKHKNKKKDEKDTNKKHKRDRAESEGFFAPTSLPSVPSGLTSDQTEIVQRLDDGTKMVTFITWADK